MPEIATRSVLRGDESNELMASARIDVSDARDLRYLRSVLSVSRSKSKRAWKWFNALSEVSGGVGRLGKIAGYAKIQAREVNPDGTPGKVLTRGMAAEIASRMSSPYGGQRALIDRYLTLMKIPGDAYLIRCRDYKADGTFVERGYDFLSADEIERASVEGSQFSEKQEIIQPNEPIRRITLPAGEASNGEQLSVEVRAQDFIGRVWRPAGQYVDLPVSPMRALDTECELLWLLTRGLKGKLASRLALNGILYFPSEINDVHTATPTASENPIHDNRIIDRLIKAAIAQAQNIDEAAGAIPIIVSGPAQYADAVRNIVLDREVYATDMALREELKDRILTGLDANKQKTKGDGDSNHFTSWSDSDDELRVNIKPDLETMMWALTRMGLHREMQERGASDRQISKTMLWYDLSGAQTNINAAEDGRQASDRIQISPAAARRMANIDESDAPTAEEYIRGLGVKISDPYLATFGMPEAKDFDWEKIGSKKTGPDAASPADEPPVGPGTKRGAPGQGDSDTPKRLRPAN